MHTRMNLQVATITMDKYIYIFEPLSTTLLTTQHVHNVKALNNLKSYKTPYSTIYNPTYGFGQAGW